MPRITLANVMASRLPAAIGLCATDTTRIAAAVNEAQERLIMAFGETGPPGGWEKVVFNVGRSDPYLTLPPEIARLVNLDICRSPVRVQNQWFQFLIGSGGLQVTDCQTCGCAVSQAVDQGYFPTAYDIPSGDNSYLRVYVTDARDIGARIFISGAKDSNGVGIYTDGNGFYMTFASPFTTTGFVVTEFEGVQKPVTWGDILLKAVDATTGDETLLARFTPDETNPSYRRYLLTGLPIRCCPPLEGEEQTVQVTGMAKLEYIPVRRATDFLIIQSIPALINECQAVRMEGVDLPNAAGMAANYHSKAMQLLNQSLGHSQGLQNPAITVTPFGSATLARQAIGYVL